jgi:predicted nucleic acid-binding protein
VILDTGALDALLQDDRSLIRLLKPHPRLDLPAIVLGEYRFGLAESSQRERLEAALDGLESVNHVLAVDERTARQYAAIRHELKLAGTPIPAHDLWIAALARQHDRTLVTRDAHFALVKGLRRLGW